MIGDVDRTLRFLLEQSLGLKGEELFFDRPDERFEQALKSPRALCLYLYDVRENREFRNAEFNVERRGDGTATVRPPAVYFDLTYLVTVYAKSREVEHELLGQVLQLLLGHPTLDDKTLQGSLKEQALTIPASVGMPGGSMDPAALWSGLGGLRPSLSYTVTVPVRPFAAEERRLVTARLLRTAEKDRTEPKPLEGRRPEESAEFAGKVRNAHDGRPVVEAQISLREVSRSAAVDVAGSYRLGWVKPGRYTLVVSAPGYREVRREIVVSGEPGLPKLGAQFDVELEAERSEQGAQSTRQSRR